MIKDNAINSWERVRLFFSTSRGRDVLLYLVFVVISFVFWFILALNNQIKETYRVKLTINDIPENVTIIDDLPQNIDVTVKNTGYALMKYLFGRTPEVKVSFSEISDGHGHLFLNRQDISEFLISTFGAEANIISFMPESITSTYTNLPGKKLPVSLKTVFQSDFQHIINGNIVMTPDSVVAYADAATLSDLVFMQTEKCAFKELSDTLRIKVALVKVPHVKMTPDSISVIIPVEPLVSKQSAVNLTTKNVPLGMRLVTFPSSVKVSYLLPLSFYDNLPKDAVEVFVDYEDISAHSTKLPIKIGRQSGKVSKASLQSDSVEFVLESL